MNKKERIVVAVCLYVFVWDGAGIIHPGILHTQADFDR